MIIDVSYNVAFSITYLLWWNNDKTMPTKIISTNEKYRNYDYKIFEKAVNDMKITLALLSFKDILNHKLKRS